MLARENGTAITSHCDERTSVRIGFEILDQALGPDIEHSPIVQRLGQIDVHRCQGPKVLSEQGRFVERHQLATIALRSFSRLKLLNLFGR